MNDYIVHVLDYRGTRPDMNEPLNIKIRANSSQSAVDQVRKNCIEGVQKVVSVFKIIHCKDWE